MKKSAPPANESRSARPKDEFSKKNAREGEPREENAKRAKLCF